MRFYKKNHTIIRCKYLSNKQKNPDSFWFSELSSAGILLKTALSKAQNEKCLT
jgi:hypothetical protein